jgi:hypothetical protein
MASLGPHHKAARTTCQPAEGSATKKTGNEK